MQYVPLQGRKKQNKTKHISFASDIKGEGIYSKTSEEMDLSWTLGNKSNLYGRQEWGWSFLRSSSLKAKCKAGTGGHMIYQRSPSMENPIRQ